LTAGDARPLGTEEPMPDFIAPMTATLADRAFDDPAWLFEVKWDGYRVEAVIRDGKVRLWTRNRGDAARYFPDLAGPPTWLDAREAIVDGEVVALDPGGRPSFSLLQARAGFGQQRDAAVPVVYEVFDLLYLDGRSLLDVPLLERKRLLAERLREGTAGGRVRYAGHVEGEGLRLHAAARDEGLEGVMAKRADGHYTPGRRSHGWLKLKVRLEQEFVVGGWEPGSVVHRDLGALLLGVYDGTGLRFAGEVGSGLDARTRRALLAQLGPLARDAAPFADPPPVRGARWVEPRLVVRVEFAEWTRDEVVRQAAYKGFEPDRDPTEVRREVPATGARSPERTGPEPTRAPEPTPEPEGTKAPEGRKAPATHRARGASTQQVPELDDAPAQAATAAELEALDSMGPNGPWEVGGHVVSLTNLDKILFAEPGFTKRHLVRYYVTVAPTLLPYLRDRGLTLDRYPNGPGGAHFWEKEVPSHAPQWVARWHYESRSPDESHTYVVADRVATLAFLANQAAIDLHPWTSRTEAPGRPTYALIDIDPGSRTSWADVLVLARLYRTALEHLGVRGYPKVTGKRGIQVWIPVEPRYEFRATSAWVEGLSRAVGASVPELVSWAWSVKERRGLARLDYTQNASNKTLVAPYAVRPAARAPVSAPIAWEELEDPGLASDRWTIATLPARLAERGDLFAGALRFDQILPALG
jgi:DNA ligase D